MINTELMRQGALELGIELGGRETEIFVRLAESLAEANRRFNLTAITREDRIVTEHFLDSLTVLSAADPRGKRALDVGTGGGYPGLPVALVCPGARCTLMDATAKKIRYIDTVSRDLGLANVTGVAARAEEAGRLPEYREAYDIVYARAVSDMLILCELCLPFVKPGGLFVAMKSAGADEEVKRAERQIAKLGGRIKDILYLDIPGTSIRRSLIVTEKLRRTPPEFPRDYARIKRQAKTMIPAPKP
ncbi:MAG: 16S rRNA (guanine(527)-N(7))-methyltransferase RsmG [Abditibacteriota bacterium]|nr:16S rRNA (guanine(527)-N(7))-methyltransferase RsmG [Abditibacteriota bacterium]